MLDAPTRRNVIYIPPGFVIYAVFVFLPIIRAAAVSFTSWNGISRPVFVALGNYVNLFADVKYRLGVDISSDETIS